MMDKFNYIESQYAAVENHQKAVKKAADSFISGIAKVTKTCQNNQATGKKDWKDALDKELTDQLKNGNKIKKILLANADVAQSSTVAAAITKIDSFYSLFSFSNYATDAGFMLMLSGQYDYSLQLEMDFSNYEGPMIINHVTTIAQSLFRNVNGKGQSCLKNMTEVFINTFKTFEAAQTVCFDDFTTYVGFSTEFVKIQMSIVKCQAEGAVNYLEACLKQISKKTSVIYNNAMYNTCLPTVSIFD